MAHRGLAHPELFCGSCEIAVLRGDAERSHQVQRRFGVNPHDCTIGICCPFSATVFADIYPKNCDGSRPTYCHINVLCCLSYDSRRHQCCEPRRPCRDRGERTGPSHQKRCRVGTHSAPHATRPNPGRAPGLPRTPAEQKSDPIDQLATRNSWDGPKPLRPAFRPGVGGRRVPCRCTGYPAGRP